MLRLALVVSLPMLTGCMTPQQKQSEVVNRVHAFCYGRGFSPGSEQYKRCAVGAYYQVQDQVDAMDQAQRERIGSALQGAGAALQGY